VFEEQAHEPNSPHRRSDLARDEHLPEEFVL
jgi:hypothetical protein